VKAITGAAEGAAVPRATVCLSFDFDAVSPWVLGDELSPTQLSRGLFGARTGVPRILHLLEEYDVPATFFTPGHTLDSFPDRSREIVEAGHGVQHHGWSHTPPSAFDSRAAERADVERGIESIERVTGERPTGYRSPSWDLSEHTLDILQELGFDWDSSGMATDYTPYYLREGWAAPADDVYDPGTETDVLELPVSWKRDDYPAFAFRGGELWGFADPARVVENWAAEFDWMYDTVEGGVYTLTMHPQVSGRGQILPHVETLIEHMRSKPGVAFRRMDDVAREFRG